MRKSDGIHHALRLYGTSWCHDTTRTRALLDDLEIEYNFYDIEKDPAMARTAYSLQNGGEKIPVVDFGDGIALIEPTNQQLHAALEQTGRVVV